MSVEIDPSLVKFIATRDKKITEREPWSPDQLAKLFARIMGGETISMGGRSTCGSSIDPTWKDFCAWGEVIKKAQQLGYAVVVEPVKQTGRYATIAGGWWHENKYSIGAQE